MRNPWTFKKKIKLTIFLATIAISFASAQNDFRKGFIVTNIQDTVQGLVAYRSNLRNYESCIFRKEANTREYLPPEIIGFGFHDDQFFSSQIVQNAFVEVLVKGDISLYKFREKYLLKKDTATFELKSDLEEIEVDGKIGYKEKSGWRGVLTYLISDCLTNSNRLTAAIKLDEKPLTKLIVRYNDCKQADFTEFKTSKPWTKIDLGISIGLVRSVIKNTSESGTFRYLDKSYNSLDPTIGLLLSISSPRLAERLSFQSEVYVMTSSYSSLVTINESIDEFHDTYIELTTLSVPLSIKYTYLRDNYGFYFQAGMNYDYHLNSSTKLLSEQITGNVVNTFPERTAFEVNKKQLGFFGGAGVLKSYSKFKSSIALRYFQMYSLNATDGFSSNNNRISINLILFKK